jgi:hypothetical protein
MEMTRMLSGAYYQTVLGHLVTSCQSSTPERSLVVGDASLLPTRVRIQQPENKPNSGTVPFWDKWGEDKEVANISNAVCELEKNRQSKRSKEVNHVHARRTQEPSNPGSIEYAEAIGWTIVSRVETT